MPLLRLAIITGDSAYERVAAAGLRSARELMTRFPTGAGQWLCALDSYLTPTREVAIIGDPEEQATQVLRAEVFRHYIPNRVLLGGALPGPGGLEELPLMQGREMIDGHATAYVCENYVCKLPVTEPQALASQLAE